MTTGQSGAVKVIAIVLAVYVGIVVVFESLLGSFQPEGGNTVVITTSDDRGSYDRVLSLLESGDQRYVAANHGPRAWYKWALENPDVQRTMAGERAAYRSVKLTGAEHDRASEAFSAGLFFRFLTGFPPRYFVRMDPVIPPVADAMAEPMGNGSEVPAENAMEEAMENGAEDAIDGALRYA